ncbi:MAG: hypothetical protein IPP71_23150 [Bacteroidetes bacterium]|nr:hypothetical protein [Bacteroidota bacterium]
MKKILFLFTFLPLSYFALGQKNKSLSDTATSWGIYRNALIFNDLDVAKFALFEILTLQPDNPSTYDSLAHLYFRIGAYSQAIQASELAKPTNALKEIKAYSYRNLGEIKIALPLFEELYAETASPENGYQVASMQFSMKRFGECMETAAKIKAHPEASKSKVLISTEQGESMNVSYLAAAENLMGVVYLEMGKTDLAKTAFEMAIEAAPEFSLAKKNLEKVNSKPMPK